MIEHPLTRIIFATGNPNKLREVRSMLDGIGQLQIIGLQELGHIEELEETGETLRANAMQKVNFIYEKFGAPAFAEDTGLEVDALNGAPGVYSARFGGPEKNAEQNVAHLLEKMEGVTTRGAQFRTVIAFRSHDTALTFDGLVRGSITEQRYGKGGFGYDPVFQPEGLCDTFGHLPPEIKHRISHRAKAWQKLKKYLIGGQ